MNYNFQLVWVQKIMTETIKESIVEKLEQMPEPELREIIDFVDFIFRKVQNREEPILQVAGVLSGEPISARNIELELYGEPENGE